MCLVDMSACDSRAVIGRWVSMSGDVSTRIAALSIGWRRQLSLKYGLCLHRTGMRRHAVWPSCRRSKRCILTRRSVPCVGVQRQERAIVATGRRRCVGSAPAPDSVRVTVVQGLSHNRRQRNVISRQGARAARCRQRQWRRLVGYVHTVLGRLVLVVHRPG